MWPFKRCKHNWEHTGKVVHEPHELINFRGAASAVIDLVRGKTQWFWRCKWCGKTTITEISGQADGVLFPDK